MDTIVKLEHVFQHMGARRVLNDVNLSIENGEAFALLGTNGAGKTLLLRLILGLDVPSAGRIEVLGRDLATLDAGGLAKLRRNVGMVFQGGSLLNELTAAENIMLPMRDEALSAEELQRRTRLLMMQLRLDGLENFRPSELSSGLLRQIEMARALVRRPSLLLWDGLGDGLDLAAGAEIQDLLMDYKKSHNMSIIMTGHRITQVEAIASRIGVLEAGRLLFAGAPEKALAMKKHDFELRCLLDGRP